MVDVEPAVKFALAQVGKPYVFGASGPNSFDCSGLTMRAFQQVGINMPHYTGSQIGYGVSVTKPGLQRGDLIFPDPGHVQIYLGNNMVVEAPHSGANVRVVNMWGFYAARRLGTDSGSDPGINNTTLISIPNPIDVYNQIKDVIDSADNTFKWLSNSHNWYRILLVVFGAFLVIIAIRNVVKNEVEAPILNAL
jgi:hypothetical protein